MAYLDDGNEFVVFELKDELYALPAGVVEQMLELPPVTRVPNTAPSCRGVINLRGRVVPLHDLRTLLSMESVAAELASIDLPARWGDHQRWADELRASVEERREFTLTTDPHQCRFGKWYDSFVTRDAWLRGLLAQFADPHAALHGCAVDVTQHMRQSQYDAAAELIHELSRGTLEQLRQLFAKAIEAMEQHYRETVVVLHRGGELAALAVDRVVGVERLSDLGDEAQPQIGGGAADAVKCFARLPSTGAVVMLLDASAESAILAF